MQPDLSPVARAVHQLLEPDAPAAAPLPWDVLARELCRLEVADAIALGFSFAGPAGDFGQRAVRARPGAGVPEGTLVLQLSPGRTHRALLWHEAEADQLRLWIGGAEWRLPRDADGTRLAEPPGHWADEDRFALPLMLVDHPLQDWSRPDGRGQVRGLLVCELGTGTTTALHPRDDEVWTEPRLACTDGRWALFADAAAQDEGRPARSGVGLLQPTSPV